MADEERSTYYATARIELEDVTTRQAQEFWDALATENVIRVGDFEAVIISVEPEWS